MPNDGDTVWIRILSPSFKPVLGECVYANNGFVVEIDGQNYIYPFIIVPQWRPQ
jgi:hypothetical protein